MNKKLWSEQAMAGGREEVEPRKEWKEGKAVRI
jgi:hypothetical protein